MRTNQTTHQALSNIFVWVSMAFSDAFLHLYERVRSLVSPYIDLFIPHKFKLRKWVLYLCKYKCAREHIYRPNSVWLVVWRLSNFNHSSWQLSSSACGGRTLSPFLLSFVELWVFLTCGYLIWMTWQQLAGLMLCGLATHILCIDLQNMSKQTTLPKSIPLIPS